MKTYYNISGRNSYLTPKHLIFSVQMPYQLKDCYICIKSTAKIKSVCVVIGVKNSFLEAMNLIKYIERYAFGICSLLGEKFGIRASTIRLYFIYVSFFTFGSPVVLYLAIAFWLNIKHYMVARKQTLWDL